MKTCVALLRGINVGGKNMLPMPRLAGMFRAAGCENVQTYIQSGNVLFRAPAAIASRIPRIISAEIAKDGGPAIPVILRTQAELVRVVTENPFLDPEISTDSLHVLFLADAPPPDRPAMLDPGRSAPDAFEVRGREVYLRLPNGAARTKLTNGYFDSKLATTSTGRNWRTTAKLLELMTALK